MTLTPELAKTYFSYDPITGFVTWIIKRGRNRPGQRVGYTNGDGGLSVKIDGKTYLVTRIIWLLYYGHWPMHGIHHVDKNCKHDAISNLKDVTHSEVHKHRKIAKNNTSGYTGITWHKANKKWFGRVRSGDDYIYIGSFTELDDAVEARNKIYKILGFTHV